MDDRLPPIPPLIEATKVAVESAASGPLAGLTLGVKDIFDVAGLPTGCGNPVKGALAEPADRHAPCVAQLLDAGASFAGKTHTVEFAFGMDGVNEHFGTPENPAAPDRLPGGSSSGSVSAVGAGLVDFALGSDTGGSVRVPGSFCGLIGLRTTLGRISTAGVMPLSQSFDTVGWFARTAETYERVGAVLLGEDEDDTPLGRLVLATDALAHLAGGEDGECARAAGEALARCEAVIGTAERVQLAPDSLRQWAQTFHTAQGFEAWRNHHAWLLANPGVVGPAVRGRFEGGHGVSEADYETALGDRETARRRVLDVLGDDGLIALPTAPDIAPRVGATARERNALREHALPLTCSAGLAGAPQISLPLATVQGAPFGFSLIGPPGRDRALIALARRILDA